MTVRFDDFELDRERFELRQSGTVISLEPQVFDVLCFLVDNRDRVVSKEDLLDGVWGDRFVSESALTSRIKAVRQALGDDGTTQRYVQTSRGRGYRFVGDVSDVADRADVGEHDDEASATSDSNLPTAASRLIGRDEIVASVRAQLGEHRLVTITAAGGTGKTRLALAIGEAEHENYRDGVWFVDLTPVADEDLVPVTIAAAVGLVLGGGDRTALVVDYLARLDALVILDNCEHLVDACADFAEAFLSRPGGTKILATTREILDVDGERAMRLPPLDFDDVSGSAVELFVERATAAGATLDIRDADRSVIQQLCQRLDGTPLAIELAAARANVMTPAELLAGLGERFELLRGGRRRRASRALEDTLDWSYDLLEADEQELFRVLGVFAGSFNLDAVMAIAQLNRAEALDLIDSLVAKSLVVSERASDRIRFRLLETTAAYAERALEEQGHAAGARDRHLDHFMRQSEPFSDGCWPNMLSIELAPDRDNVRAAIRWAQTSDRWEEAARLAFAAATALEQQPKDLLAIITACLERLDDRPLSETIALRSTYVYQCNQHDFELGPEVISALEDDADPFVRAVGRVWTAMVELTANRPEECLAIIDAALPLVDSAPPSTSKHQFLDVTDVISGWALANLAENEQCLARHVAVQRREGPPTVLKAESWAAAGVAHIALGDPEAALGIASQLDDDGYLYYESDELRAIAHLALGQLDVAEPLIAEHAADAVTGRLSRKASNTLLLLALLAEAEGDVEKSAELLMSVGHARRPGIAPSLELAERLGVSSAFDLARSAAVADRNAAGRSAVEVLRTEMTRRGWDH